MATVAEASLNEQERRVLDRLVGLLQAEFGDDLKAVWLYGSRARGERPGPDSDVDLLVLTETGRDDLSKVTHLVTQAADTEGASPVFFAAHVHDLEWLAGRRAIESFFIQEVDRDKIVLYGKP